MNTNRKLLIFVTIVWAFFVLGMLLVHAYGLDAPEASPPNQMEVELELLTNPDLLCLVKTAESTEVKPSTIEYEAPKPIVADPIFGKDLYLFYIAQIHEQYYPLLDPYIVQAVLELESNYDPHAESKYGAVGLMQVLPQYHSYRSLKYGLNDLWDPYTNIIVGMDYLNELYTIYWDWRIVLYGYNRSTAYVNSVLDRADYLKGVGYFG